MNERNHVCKKTWLHNLIAKKHQNPLNLPKFAILLLGYKIPEKLIH